MPGRWQHNYFCDVQGTSTGKTQIPSFIISSVKKNKVSWGPGGILFGLFGVFITPVCLFKPYGFAKKNLLVFTRNKQPVEQAFIVINSVWHEGMNQRSTATIKAVLLLKVNVNDTRSVIN